ncbi:MAG TPA: CdaR family protein [Clostridia bacterium]|mgnify:CR=1 FL=1|nr:CdaR family protein [Clostridia bacterium]
MENNNAKGKRVADLSKGLLLKNLGIKIAALLLATVLWGIVLTVQNPNRIKVLSKVPVSFALGGEADLLARDLVVRGNPLKELGGVSVRVSTPITTYMELNAEHLAASVSLNSVISPGVWMLPINATVSARLVNTWVEREGINPDKIAVEIDTLMKKTVPVEAFYEGTLPAGYWADTAELSALKVDIRGPKQDVERATKAICKIQMNNRTQSYNNAVNVTLLDSEGEEISSNYFLGSLPAVTVRMAVYSKKTVPVDVIGSLLGADNLPTNYRLYAASSTPALLDIVGDSEVLKGIDKLMLTGLDVAGKREPVHGKLAILLPEGVSVLGSNGEAEVYVDIREKNSRKVFEAVPIDATGLERGLKARISDEITTISVEGRITLVDSLERNDVHAYVDLKNLKEGTYNLPVGVRLGDEQKTEELTFIRSVAQVTVILERT